MDNYFNMNSYFYFRIFVVCSLFALLQSSHVLSAKNTKDIYAIPKAENQFSFSLVTNDTIIGKPGDVIQFVAKFRNLTHNDLNIFINRTEKNLPFKWESQYCAGTCFPPDRDTSTLYVSPDDTQAFTLDISTNEIEGEGNVAFTFVSKENPENKFTQVFNAITRNETNVSEMIYSEMKLEVYPNPANQSSVVSCRLPFAGQVRLSLYNLIGVEVASLYDGYCESGIFNYQLSIVNYQLPNCIYLLKLQGKEFSICKPIFIK
jgi:hypothetical protein